MRAVFADSGYWIALWRPRDALHEKAMIAAESLGEIAVVTTQLVLTEALNAMAGAGEFHRRSSSGRWDNSHTPQRQSRPADRHTVQGCR